MKCIHESCNAPARHIARVKNGPGDWSIMPKIAACNEHAAELPAAAPKNKTVQVIPVPSGVDAMSSEKVTEVCEQFAKRPDGNPNALAVVMELPRQNVIACLRMAGFKI